MSKRQPVDRGGYMTTREVVIELALSEHAVRNAFDAGRLTGRRTPGGYRQYDRTSVAALKQEMLRR